MKKALTLVLLCVIGVLVTLFITEPQPVQVRVVTRFVERQLTPDEERRNAREVMVLAALEYAAKDNAHPPVGDMEKMVKAAFITAEAFPDFGPEGFYARAAKHLAYGYGETRWRLGDVSYNLPGYTPGVRFFSVDFFWAGLNEQNFGKNGNLRNWAARLIKDGTLPKMQLMWPPSRKSILKAHAEYKAQLAAGIRPSKMHFHVRIYETTQDDVTSALAYRIIEERERRRLGLRQTYYKGANDRAQAYIEKALRAHNLE